MTSHHVASLDFTADHSSRACCSKCSCAAPTAQLLHRQAVTERPADLAACPLQARQPGASFEQLAPLLLQHVQRAVQQRATASGQQLVSASAVVVPGCAHLLWPPLGPAGTQADTASSIEGLLEAIAQELGEADAAGGTSPVQLLHVQLGGELCGAAGSGGAALERLQQQATWSTEPCCLPVGSSGGSGSSAAAAGVTEAGLVIEGRLGAGVQLPGTLRVVLQREEVVVLDSELPVAEQTIGEKEEGQGVRIRWVAGALHRLGS
jgi:hypothetical protein